MALKLNPTILLKGIEYQKVLSDYLNGKFRDSTNKDIIIKSSVKDINAPVYGNDNNSSSFAIKAQGGCVVVMATTGNKEVYRDNPEECKMGGLCEYCHRKFTHESIGYPVSYDEKSEITNTEEGAVFKTYYIFSTEGSFCGFPCRLGFLRSSNLRSGGYRGSSISDCERFLKMMYYLCAKMNGLKTIKTLNPAKDPRLLKSNGGSLTDEEWDEDDIVYERSDRIIIVPAKSQYMKKTL